MPPSHALCRNRRRSRVQFPPSPPPIQPSLYSQEIYNTLNGMKKEQRAESTTRCTIKRLRHIARNCNLNNPEEILTFLAKKKGKTTAQKENKHSFFVWVGSKIYLKKERWKFSVYFSFSGIGILRSGLLFHRLC